MLNAITSACGPSQIISFDFPFDDITDICICSNNTILDINTMEFSYSIDGVCWACYSDFDTLLSNTIDLNQDFFFRIKINQTFDNISINGKTVDDYSLQMASDFKLPGEGCENNQYTFSPYSNMDGAIQLQQMLTDTLSCIYGIPIYYFKVDPVVSSKDVTFKEYCLMGVSSIKQIKLFISDGVMPSSKPEFTDLGIDWQTDWETEISKSSFATAFGNTAQPMEGDLVYIPMMKRMWMVNAAYEEKNGSLMWNATTFKVLLVRYQEKGSVNLGDADSFVKDLVKNKYEDLFGEYENVDSGEAVMESPLYAANTLYPVYESDAVRKLMSCDTINYKEDKYYYKGSLISDSQYLFNQLDSKIVYQKTYCGEEGTISFIITPYSDVFSNTCIEIGGISIDIRQQISDTDIYFNTIDKCVNVSSGKTYFVFIRWSKALNIVDINACEYKHNENIPLYKLQPAHYYFDIDDAKKLITKYNIELIVDNKKEVIINNINGTLTNFKLFDTYIDTIPDILMMYPNNKHLIINDTARKVIDHTGVNLK